MLAKLTRGNQITIPKSIVERLGLKMGKDYVDIEYEDGIVYLRPVDIEDRIPAEAWGKFKKKTLEKEKGDVTLTAREAEGFLARRAKRN
jgi:AbrB family looped-hinge helix DNA binding protein